MRVHSMQRAQYTGAESSNRLKCESAWCSSAQDCNYTKKFTEKCLQIFLPTNIKTCCVSNFGQIYNKVQYPKYVNINDYELHN